MKKIFIIFLFIIFSSSFSLAKNNERITVEEIEDILFDKEDSLRNWRYLKEAKNILDEDYSKTKDDTSKQPDEVKFKKSYNSKRKIDI